MSRGHGLVHKYIFTENFSIAMFAIHVFSSSIYDGSAKLNVNSS